jgi:hypothetical protein
MPPAVPKVAAPSQNPMRTQSGRRDRLATARLVRRDCGRALPFAITGAGVAFPISVELLVIIALS